MSAAGLTEEPMVFGDEEQLVGVLTRPAVGDATVPVFVFFNSGVLPRIGSHRINVKLARALAAEGVTSLRFDLSGQGDSRAAAAGGDFREQALRDLGAAMDHLQRLLGERCRFALFGVCSGATHAFRMAGRDPRVVAALMFDGFWYRSRWTLPMRHLKRLRSHSPASFAAMVWRRLARSAARGQPAATGAPQAAAQRVSNLPRDEFVRDLQKAVDRGAAMYFVYSGSVIDYYSYAGQFRHAFAGERFVDAVRCELHPDIDHTFVSLDVQRRTVRLLLDWLPDLRRVATTARSA